MRREVAVPEPEPARESDPAQRGQAGEAVAREAPPATPRRDAGERVDDGVEVRRDVEPEELLVVAGVADDREPPRVSASDEAREEPGPAHATRQHRDPHGWRSGLGLPISLDAAVEGGALDRDAVHGAHQRLDLLGRGVLARVRARLARDALLHERAAEVVAAGAQRELGETVTELHPRRLQVVDEAAQHEPAGGVDAEVTQPLRLWRARALVRERPLLPED